VLSHISVNGAFYLVEKFLSIFFLLPQPHQLDGEQWLSIDRALVSKGLKASKMFFFFRRIHSLDFTLSVKTNAVSLSRLRNNFCHKLQLIKLQCQLHNPAISNFSPFPIMPQSQTLNEASLSHSLHLIILPHQLNVIISSLFFFVF
jgi:hypothetical protein